MKITQILSPEPVETEAGIIYYFLSFTLAFQANVFLNLFASCCLIARLSQSNRLRSFSDYSIIVISDEERLLSVVTGYVLEA